MTGRVVRISRDKGFFFIKPDGSRNPQDHFAHMSALKNGTFEELQEDARVEFDSMPNPKGPRAERVFTLLDGAVIDPFENLFTK
jgi:cold shock CspA family protein